MYRQSEKNLLNSNTSSTCPDNIVNFGLLTAEIFWRVWGTPANFNGFRVLAALLHGTLVVGVSQTAALNRGRHLYSAGWPSRWALAHILVVSLIPRLHDATGCHTGCTTGLTTGRTFVCFCLSNCLDNRLHRVNGVLKY